MQGGGAGVKKLNQNHGERGAVLVEFAVVIPILLILLMGIVEVGLLFYNQQVLTNASREGARAGISHLAVSEVTTIVENYCQDRMIRFDSDTAPTTTVTGIPGSFGDNVTVNVNYPYTFLVPDLLGFGPNLQLQAETIMRMERPLSP